jgi:hypothetical protein
MIKCCFNPYHMVPVEAVAVATLRPGQELLLCRLCRVVFKHGQWYYGAHVQDLPDIDENGSAGGEIQDPEVLT